MFGDRPDEETATRTSPGPSVRLQLELEDVLVAVVVGDRAEDLDVGAQALHPREQARADADALDVVALEVVGDGCRPAVPAGEHRRVSLVGAVEDPCGRLEPPRVDGDHGAGQLPRVVGGEASGVVVPPDREARGGSGRRNARRGVFGEDDVDGRREVRHGVDVVVHRRSDRPRCEGVGRPRPGPGRRRTRCRPRPMRRTGPGRGPPPRRGPSRVPACGPHWPARTPRRYRRGGRGRRTRRPRARPSRAISAAMCLWTRSTSVQLVHAARDTGLVGHHGHREARGVESGDGLDRTVEEHDVLDRAHVAAVDDDRAVPVEQHPPDGHRPHRRGWRPSLAAR